MAERWLVIDDSSTIQRVIKLAFQGYDVHITEADSVQEAAREMTASQPTLVIADAALGGVQGVQDFLALKAQAPQAPFIILEGSYDNIDEAQFRSAGFRHFLKKPFDGSQLLSITRQALGRALPYRGEAAVAASAGAPQPTATMPPPPPPLRKTMSEGSFPPESTNTGFDLGLHDTRAPDPRAVAQTLVSTVDPRFAQTQVNTGYAAAGEMSGTATGMGTAGGNNMGSAVADIRGGNNSADMRGGNMGSSGADTRGGNVGSGSPGDMRGGLGSSSADMRGNAGDSRVGNNMGSGGNPNNMGSGSAADMRGGNPSDMRGNAGDVRGGNPSDMRGGNPSDMRGGNPSDMRGGNPSDMRGGNPSDMRGNPGDTRGGMGSSSSDLRGNPSDTRGGMGSGSAGDMRGGNMGSSGTDMRSGSNAGSGDTRTTHSGESRSPGGDYRPGDSRVSSGYDPRHQFSENRGTSPGGEPSDFRGMPDSDPRAKGDTRSLIAAEARAMASAHLNAMSQSGSFGRKETGVETVRNPVSFSLEDDDLVPPPATASWDGPRPAGSHLGNLLEPMLQEEMEKIVRASVEDYCRKHFASIARELIQRELDRLTQDRNRLLMD